MALSSPPVSGQLRQPEALAEVEGHWWLNSRMCEFFPAGGPAVMSIWVQVGIQRCARRSTVRTTEMREEGADQLGRLKG